MTLTDMYDDSDVVVVRTMTACLLVVISFCSFRVLRSASGHYSVWVALANILNDAAVMTFAAADSPQCAAMGFLRTYAMFAAFAVSVVIATRVHMLFHGADTSPLQQLVNEACACVGFAPLFGAGATTNSVVARQRRWGRGLRVSLEDVFFVWVAPAPLACIPLLFGPYYGRSQGQQFCWLTTDAQEVPYLYLYYFVPLWCTIAYTVFLYGSIVYWARRRMKADADSPASRRTRALLKKLVWYPFNLVFCTMFSTVYAVMDISGDRRHLGVAIAGSEFPLRCPSHRQQVVLHVQYMVSVSSLPTVFPLPPQT